MALGLATALACGECPQCHYVLGRATVVSTVSHSRPLCPNCQKVYTDAFFPSIFALELLDMVDHFMQLAEARTDDLNAQLVRSVYEQTTQTFDARMLKSVAQEIQTAYEQAGNNRGEQWVFDDMLQVLQDQLSLQSRDDALQIFPTVFRFTQDTFPEHKVAVTLTCTFLERTLDDVLTVLGTTDGMTLADAEQAIDNFRNIKQRQKFFDDHTHVHVSLDDAIDQCARAIPDFRSHWRDIQDKRSDFTHGKPWALNATTAQLAFNMAKNAIAVLAELQNRYCIGRASTV